MLCIRRSTLVEAICITIIVGIGYFASINSMFYKTVYAEQRITIIPDAHASTAVRFVDVVDYILPVGERLTWLNDDSIAHELIVMNDANSTGITDFNIAPKRSYSYVFEEPGKYYYSSKDYPKVQGSVNVLDPGLISVEKKTGLKNNIDVQLAWAPSRIALNLDEHSSDDGDGTTEPGRADFIITFIDNKTGMNQQHIDYEFSIYDESDNILFNHGSHSTYGVEEVKYDFEKLGSFNPQIMITNVLFAPVDPDVADFGNIISVG
jgi:hypothetical protein